MMNINTAFQLRGTLPGRREANENPTERWRVPITMRGRDAMTDRTRLGVLEFMR